MGKGWAGTSLKDNRAETRLEIDLSELHGRTYSCIDNCALCCLCQPELLPDEEARFRADPTLARGIVGRHISPEVKGAAIRLRGDHGACYFLDNRRCSIYAERPHFCRLFPLNVYAGWRIQLNANLSCRGVGQGGSDLEALGRRALTCYGNERLESELLTSKRVYAEFVRNTRDSGTAQSFSSVRSAAEMLSDELVDETGLSRILTYAEHGRTRQNASPIDLVKQVRKTEADADVHERAVIDGTELFDLPDLSLLPVYIDESLIWRVFRLVDKEIVGYLLSEDGSVVPTSRTNPSDVELLPMDAQGRMAMKDYLGTVNGRDCFIGHAAYLEDMEGYESNFAQAYLGAMATNAIDLWWRTSFLASLAGSERLGEKEIREGIVFFDMDALDLPTIGAFI